MRQDSETNIIVLNTALKYKIQRNRRWHRGHAPGKQTEPQLEAATSTDVTLPETGQVLLLCSLQCGNNCNVVVKLVHASFVTCFK